METEIKFRDYPIMGWLFGAVAAGWGAYDVMSNALFPGLLGILVGAAFLILGYGLTITADKQTRMLTLDYRSLLLHTVKELRLDDIASIRLDSRISRGSKGRRSTAYCIIAEMKNGEALPFRSFYSGGFFMKQKIVDGLRVFIGLPEAFDAGPIGILRAAPKMGAAAARVQQQEFTGVVEELQVTDGIHWMLQPIGIGATPATRWFSPDVKTQGGFLFLAQKAAGQSSGGFLASLAKTLFRQSLSLYGFAESDTPNLVAADVYAGLSTALDTHFMAFTSDPVEARQLLNPWVQNPLAEWGARYPLKQFQSGGQFSQLVVLFSPNGIYIATPSTLNSDQLTEITRLGVELVKAQ